MRVRRQADESLLCGEKTTEAGRNAKRHNQKTRSSSRHSSIQNQSRFGKWEGGWDEFLHTHLTCPVEFSMTCASGILVDIFLLFSLDVAKKKGK